MLGSSSAAFPARSQGAESQVKQVGHKLAPTWMLASQAEALLTAPQQWPQEQRVTEA